MGDVGGGDVERGCAEGVGDVDAKGLAASGEVKDLAEGCVAEVVGREGVLRFGDLLGCGPGDYPGG